MEIKLHEIPVREVVEGYIDSAENGVTGYIGGKCGEHEKCKCKCGNKAEIQNK